MRIVAISLFLLSWLSILGQDTTNCQLLKSFDLNQRETDQTVAISSNDEIVFYMELKPFLKFAKKKLSVFDDYFDLYQKNKGYRHFGYDYDDTLYIELSHSRDSSEYYISSHQLSIRLFCYDKVYSTSISEIDSSYKTDEVDNLLIIKNFSYELDQYILKSITKGKKVKVYNLMNQQFVRRVIKESFSYYYGPLTAGGGYWYRIPGTTYLLRRVQEWIS